MPNRIIKESINESRELNATSPFAQDLYKRLITYADDYGRFNVDTEIMLARLYPREVDAVNEADLLDAIIELAGIGKVRFYTNQRRRAEVFGLFPQWSEHQRVRFTRAKCPDPETEEVNDWALKRVVPIAMKVAIFERDRFKCCECGQDFRRQRFYRHGD